MSTTQRRQQASPSHISYRVMVPCADHEGYLAWYCDTPEEAREYAVSLLRDHLNMSHATEQTARAFAAGIEIHQAAYYQGKQTKYTKLPFAIEEKEWLSL